MKPSKIFSTLVSQTLSERHELPNDQRGIYAIHDRHGNMIYIGCTTSDLQNFRSRIGKHISGSEGHFLSGFANAGRMYCKTGKSPIKPEDASVSKFLRNEFNKRHYWYTYIALDLSDVQIKNLEREVIELAKHSGINLQNDDWESMQDEPVEIVDALLKQLEFTAPQIAAVNRQACIWKSLQS